MSGSLRTLLAFRVERGRCAAYSVRRGVTERAGRSLFIVPRFLIICESGHV